VRAVLDPNIIISALLSRTGSPARVLRSWEQGAFELVVSPLLLAELERALEYPKIRSRINREEAARVLAWLRNGATVVSDSEEAPPVRSRDPGDDYLLALAGREQSALVSGDEHLLALVGELPVFSTASFLSRLE
jgi:putative PIN family toxin of toxin-antitoxin system